jgi:predicted nucleic acid-binding protein
MMIEYEAVLTRREHLTAAGLTRTEVGAFLDGLARLIIPVTPSFLWRPQLTDPNDEIVLDAAVSGGCNAIVTFNTRHFTPAAARFDIEVLTPAHAIRRVQ